MYCVCYPIVVYSIVPVDIYSMTYDMMSLREIHIEMHNSMHLPLQYDGSNPVIFGREPNMFKYTLNSPLYV